MRRVALLLALVLLPSAWGLPARLAAEEGLSALLGADPVEGGRLFIQKGCFGCHAVQGVGGTIGPDLGRGIPNRPLLEIAGVMWNHSPRMDQVFRERRMPRPVLEPAEMANLLAFLYYLGSFDPPGDPGTGARLFAQKGCQGCHALGGRGGRVGPALDRFGQYATPLPLTAALWNRGPAMAAKMREKGVPRPSFQRNDIPDLLAYIRSASGVAGRTYAVPGNPRRGEELFTQKRCVECHAVHGEGGKVGPDLGVELRGGLTRIAGTMWNHGPKMWATMAERGIEVPALKTEEMADLISYLYFLQFVEPRGDVRRGAAVYRDKACGACHVGVAGMKGGAPRLEQLIQKFDSPLALVTAMWNHAGKMQAAAAERNLAWPALKGGEMADLVAHLFAQAQKGGTR